MAMVRGLPSAYSARRSAVDPSPILFAGPPSATVTETVLPLAIATLTVPQPITVLLRNSRGLIDAGPAAGIATYGRRSASIGTQGGRIPAARGHATLAVGLSMYEVGHWSACPGVEQAKGEPSRSQANFVT